MVEGGDTVSMRPIKFRAWGKDGAEGPKIWDWEYIRECFDVWLSNSVVEQFTGLLDNTKWEQLTPY
jgi:hypothetical protein